MGGQSWRNIGPSGPSSQNECAQDVLKPKNVLCPFILGRVSTFVKAKVELTFFAVIIPLYATLPLT